MADRDDMTDSRAIGNLQQRFAAEFAAAVSTLTGRSVSVQPARWARQSRMQFLQTVREPTCCCTLSTASEASLPALLEVAPAAAWMMIDSLLGGPGDGTYLPSRALTAVENRLLARVAAAAGQCLARIQPAAPVPQVDSCSPGLVLDFVIGVGGSGDAMRLFLPEAMTGVVDAADSSRRSGPVEISVTTGEISLLADELAELAAGDILTTDAPGDGEVIIRVAGIPKYRARLGACNGRRAVTIIGPVESAPSSQPQ